MKLANLSKYKLYKSMSEYEVPKDYADPIYNYLVHGFEPGSFFTSVLANDFMGAITRSHPGNTIAALKNLVSWIVNHLENGVEYGSYDAVESWCKTPEDDRRSLLEHLGLIYTGEEEIMRILKGEQAVEPFFW